MPTAMPPNRTLTMPCVVLAAAAGFNPNPTSQSNPKIDVSSMKIRVVGLVVPPQARVMLEYPAQVTAAVSARR